MQMDDMTGLEFLNLLEEEKPEIVHDVPIVFLTGMNEVPKSRAAGLIRKPTELNTFLVSIQQYIEMGHHSPYKSLNLSRN
jgi:CheY-like chemotaxis protein